MKKKIWIYYVIMNIALIALLGFLTFQAFFPKKVVYTDPVVLLEKTLVYGDTLKVMDPDVVDNSNEECTYHFSVENTTDAARTFYLYLQVTGDKAIVDILTVKIKDSGLLLSYTPNFPIKTVNLQPGEKTEFTLKVYLDMLQIIDTTAFPGAKVTLTVFDDYARFYGLLQE